MNCDVKAHEPFEVLVATEKASKYYPEYRPREYSPGVLFLTFQESLSVLQWLVQPLGQITCPNTIEFLRVHPRPSTNGSCQLQRRE